MDSFLGEKFLYAKYPQIRDLVVNRRKLIQESDIESKSLKAKYIIKDFLEQYNLVLTYKDSKQWYFEYFQQFCVQKESISDATVKRILDLDEKSMLNIDKHKAMLHLEHFNVQKETIFMWFDLIFNSYMYPTWAKYWVLKGLEKMAFNANKKKIIRRKKSTLLDFPEIIPSVFHTTMNCVIQAVENSSQEFLNQDIEFIFSKEYKNSKPDFWDVYGYFYQQSVLNFQSLYHNTQGVWIDYEGIDDSYVLYTSLLEYPVAWCVKSIEYCKRILDQQILSVYYTQDNKGEYCVPRMAILYSENQDSSITIEQFRGVDEYQSLDYFMYKEQSYVDKFLEILNQEEFLVFLEEIYYLINMIESRFKSNNFEICEDNKKIFEALLQEDFLSRFSFISKERLELFLSKTVSKPTS